MVEVIGPAWQAVFEAAVRWLPVLAIAGLSARLLRRRPARERHAVWAVGLACLAVLPLIGGHLPVGSVAVSPEWAPALAVPGSESSPARSVVAPRRPEAPADSSRATSPAAPGNPGSATGGPLPSAETPDLRARATESSWAGLVGGGWALGTLLLLAWECLSMAATGALSRGARKIPPEELPLDLRPSEGRPAILSGATELPILFGIRRPRILLPGDWRCWPDSWLRAVVLHERAHALRRDLVVLALGRLIRAVFWFHPGAWIAMKALRREAEAATDERVLGSGMDRFDYANALLGLARHLGGGRIPLAALPTAAPAGIKQRLLRIVATGSPPSRRRPRVAMLGAVAPIAGVCLVVASPVLQASEWLDRSPLDGGGSLWRSACPVRGEACLEITERATRLLREMEGGGAVAVQDVASGRVTAYVLADPGDSLPAVPAVPISAVAGLPLAAAWWEAGMGDRSLPCPAVINLSGVGSFANTNGLDTGRIRAPGEVVAMQCGSGAIAMAWYMNDELGVPHLDDAFTRWGFAPDPGDPFWSDGAIPSPALPSVARHPSGESATWLVAGSAHGTVRTTPLHVTRFLQAVANGGRMSMPSTPGARADGASRSYMDPATAGRLLELLIRAGGGGARVVGMTAHSAVAGRDEAAEVFAGYAVDDADHPQYAVSVWLPLGHVEGGVRGGAGTARMLAAQLLTGAP